jgi:subtilisin family serine protease
MEDSEPFSSGDVIESFNVVEGDGWSVTPTPESLEADQSDANRSNTSSIPVDFGGVGMSDPFVSSNGTPAYHSLFPGAIPAGFGDVDWSDEFTSSDRKPDLDLIDPSVSAIAEARAAGQWYLDNTAPGQLDLNVAEVWRDYTGRGVRVAVYDDGVEGSHPDLNDNYKGGPTLWVLELMILRPIQTTIMGQRSLASSLRNETVRVRSELRLTPISSASTERRLGASMRTTSSIMPR